MTGALVAAGNVWFEALVVTYVTSQSSLAAGSLSTEETAPTTVDGALKPGAAAPVVMNETGQSSLSVEEAAPTTADGALNTGAAALETTAPPLETGATAPLDPEGKTPATEDALGAATLDEVPEELAPAEPSTGLLVLEPERVRRPGR